MLGVGATSADEDDLLLMITVVMIMILCRDMAQASKAGVLCAYPHTHRTAQAADEM